MATRVLFVDDEPLILRGLQRLLSRTPTLELRCCRSAAEALEVLKAETFSIVVSDWQMPSMNGSHFLQLAAERAPMMPQIVLTGSIGEEERIRAETRARVILEKPCRAEVLIKAIEDEVARP